MAIDFLIYPHPKGCPDLVMASPLADASFSDLISSVFSGGGFLEGSRFLSTGTEFEFVSTAHDKTEEDREQIEQGIISSAAQNVVKLTVVDGHQLPSNRLPLLSRSGELLSPYSIRATLRLLILTLTDSPDFQVYRDDYREILCTPLPGEESFSSELDDVLFYEERISERTSRAGRMIFRSGMWIPLRFENGINAIAHLVEHVGENDFEAAFWSAAPIDRLKQGQKLHRRIVRQGNTSQARQVLEKEIGIIL